MIGYGGAQGYGAYLPPPGSIPGYPPVAVGYGAPQGPGGYPPPVGYPPQAGAFAQPPPPGSGYPQYAPPPPAGPAPAASGVAPGAAYPGTAPGYNGYGGSYPSAPAAPAAPVASASAASAGPQAAAPSAAVRAGPPPGLAVTGCQHETVGGIVRGNFRLHGDNHTKPVYKKDTQVNGLDVMVYYWDDRDGPNFCGWWFGPKVGGDQVWAYHPDKSAGQPPGDGWKVPYDGPVDSSFKVTPHAGSSASLKNSQPAQQQPPQQQPPQQQPQQQPLPQQQPPPPQQQPPPPQQAPPQPQPPPHQSGWGPPPGLPVGQPGFAGPQPFPFMPPPGFPGGYPPQPMPAVWGQPQADVMRRREDDRRRQDKRKQEEESAARKREDEHRRKLAEAKQREEDQRRRKEDEARKKEEEAKRKRELEEKRRQEQKSTLAIRRVIQKVRTATPENFEELQKELQDVLTQELENTGSQKQRMTEESDKGLDQARKRIEQINEQRRKEQEKKESEERKKREAEGRARELVKDLENLVNAAEGCARRLKELATPLEDGSALSVADVEDLSRKVEEGGNEAKVMTKSCTDFILQKGPEMKDQASQSPGEGPSETKQTLAKLLQRINECTKMAEANVQAARGAKDKAARRAVAREKTQAMEATFKKYDKDSDGFLSRKEVAAYARLESKLTMNQDMLDSIWKGIVEEGSMGVNLERFQWLRIAIGTHRELVRDKKRKKEREEKERVLKDMKVHLFDKIKAATVEVDDADKDLMKCEDQVAPLLMKAKKLRFLEMVLIADNTDELIKDAKDSIAIAAAEVSSLSEGLDERYEVDLKAFLKDEAKGLEIRIGRMEPRIQRCVNLSMRFRSWAKKKRVAEMELLRRCVVKVLRYNQSLKKFNTDELFEHIDTDGDGEVDQEEFLSFLDVAKKDVMDVEMDLEPVPEETGDNREEHEDGHPANVEEQPGSDNLADEAASALAEARGQDAAEAEANGEASVEKQVGEIIGNTTESKVEDDENKATKARFVAATRAVLKIGFSAEEKQVEVSKESLARLFDYLVETSCEEENGLSKEVFRRIVRVHMKVVQGAAMTGGMSVLSGKTIRRLEVGEVVEVLQGPMRLEPIDVLRIQARVMGDGIEGWVTVLGNQGTTFLEDGGQLFKVVKETILTDDFEIESSKEETRKLQSATRRLKEGEVLEVLEWPKLEGKSGLLRMRGKVRSDGTVGWVTVKGNAGTEFLEVV